MRFPTTPKLHKIEWLNMPSYKGETINPIRACDRDGNVGWHCEHASTGCDACYAEAIDLRFGLGHGYKKQNLTGGTVTPFLDEKMLAKPLHWKQPRAIFWNDMSDGFGEWVQRAWIQAIFNQAFAAPRHRHIFLTKRPERMAAELAAWNRVGASFPFWLGTTVENQAMADERIPYLLKCPAAVRFLSIEPMLGPVNILPWFDEDPLSSTAEKFWVIVGPETGPRRRSCDPEWIRGIVDQCAAAGVPCFVKAFGIYDGPKFRISKAPAEWPEWARTREFPEVFHG